MKDFAFVGDELGAVEKSEGFNGNGMVEATGGGIEGDVAGGGASITWSGRGRRQSGSSGIRPYRQKKTPNKIIFALVSYT